MIVSNPRGIVENCPRCGKSHPIGSYVPRPELKVPGTPGTPWAPPDVDCSCGAKLRAIVPIFKVNDSGYVWTIL